MPEFDSRILYSVILRNYNSYSIEHICCNRTLTFIYVRPVDNLADYYMSKFSYASSSFFLAILSHFSSYLSIYIPILCHYSLFFHPPILLRLISASMFMHPLSEICSTQIIFLYISICDSKLLPCHIRDKSAVHCSF